MNEQPLLLIDGDLILHRAASVVEHEANFGDDVWILSSNLGEAKEAFHTALNHYLSALGSDDFLVCLSDPDANFRKELTDTYKSHRKAQRKPLAFKPLRDWVISEYKTLQRPKLEADDCLGIIATAPNQRKTRIVVSEDKDLKTIPGWLFQKNNLTKITEAEANRFWLIQSLTGDPADGYKGCPGIGEVRAEKIIGNRPDYGLVEMAFIKAGLSKADALLSARLARILRHENWDQDKQEIKLWNP